ncbi:MAG: helix-turn-helix domain-containing protein [Myxococcota bacterium]
MIRPGMPAPIPERLKRQLVATYKAGKSGSYAQTAELFGVGEATVSRALRLDREKGGDLSPAPHGGGRSRIVDLAWLREHAEANPDATLSDRVDAWESRGGRRVSRSTMCSAMKALGWTHKKSPSSRTSVTVLTS